MMSFHEQQHHGSDSWIDDDNNNNNNNNNNDDDVLRQFSLMCQQEERYYHKVNYFQMDSLKKKLHHDTNDNNALGSVSHHTHHPNSKQQLFDIDEYSRQQMMTWCYDVAHYCHFQNTTVEMAMNLMDRFMMTNQGHDALYDRTRYQLVCMTAFYTIAKIHEHKCIDLTLLSSLSQNMYTEQQFVSMESVILHSVHWYVNAPSTTTYIDLMLQLIPTTMLHQCHHEMIYQAATEYAKHLLYEPNLLSIKSSVIAYYSLTHVFQKMETSINHHTNIILSKYLSCFFDFISEDCKDEMTSWMKRHFFLKDDPITNETTILSPIGTKEGYRNINDEKMMTTNCYSCSSSPKHVSSVSVVH
jgi:Cyclin, N-terminal domain